MWSKNTMSGPFKRSALADSASILILILDPPPQALLIKQKQKRDTHRSGLVACPTPKSWKRMLSRGSRSKLSRMTRDF